MRDTINSMLFRIKLKIGHEINKRCIARLRSQGYELKPPKTLLEYIQNAKPQDEMMKEYIDSLMSPNPLLADLPWKEVKTLDQLQDELFDAEEKVDSIVRQINELDKD